VDGRPATDPKAHRQNDLVTVAVVENLSATGSADSTVNKIRWGREAGRPRH
jgi:flagellar basal body L-ring protein FlgH